MDLKSWALIIMQENLTLLHANNKGPDQHVNLITAFVIHFLESIKAELAT